MTIKDPSRVLDEISLEHVPQDLNLLPGILAQIQKGNQSTRKPRNKFVLAFVLTMILLVVLVFTVPGVASAMRKMLGFIPGIGMVDQTTPLRVLARPVTDSRDGFTITVENAVIDSQHTVITYKVEGPFEAETTQSNGDLTNVCFNAAELRLPNGTTLRAPADLPNTTWASGYTSQNSYPSIPADINQATLFLPCLHARLSGQGPENWEVQLSFVLAPSDFAIYPISGQITPTAEAAAMSTPANSPNDINLKLESVIPLPDGQLVQTRLDWSANPKIAGVTLYPEDVKIFDASGREIAFEPSNEAIDPSESDSKSAPYGYKTAAIEASGPARLVVNAASEVNYLASTSFTFDPGLDRQPTQTWELNKVFEIDGRTLLIKTITITEMDGNASIEFEMESPDGIIGAGVFDTRYQAISGSSMVGDGVSPIQRFASSFNYDDGLPAGPITLTVTGYTLRLLGLWVVEWMPVIAPTQDAAASQDQGSCLSQAEWKAALVSSQPIPAEINRRILLEGFDTGSSTHHLSIARLDGSEIHSLIEGGHDASVSPDGSQGVYLGPHGVNVYNFSTAVSELIPNTSSNTGVFQAFWSPDGKSIAFTGTLESSSPNIFLANLGGSGPTLLATSEPLKLMQGWMPDGNILYVSFGEKGPALKSINPGTGETSILFNVPQLATPITLSKDGRRLAMVWQEEPQGKQIFYIHTLDGSQRKTLLEVPGEGYIRSTLWSPDGNWLLVDLTWNLSAEPYAKALVNIDTCQIIPIPHIEGKVDDWLP